jgi:hypothetical protein
MDDPSFLYGAFVGSLVAGIGCGLLPLAVGVARQRPYLGRGGLLLCFILGLAGGLLLALPAALVVAGAIVLLGPPKSRTQAARLPVLLPQPAPAPGTAPIAGDPAVRPSAVAGFSDSGVVLSCGRCSFMISTEGGRIPPWCPHCGADIKRPPANAPAPPPAVTAEAPRPAVQHPEHAIQAGRPA